MREVKEGTLVVITANTDMQNEYGIVGELATDTDYPNDYWINFLNGKRLPYGDYEFEAVTKEQEVESKIMELEKLKKYLPEY